MNTHTHTCACISICAHCKAQVVSWQFFFQVALCKIQFLKCMLRVNQFKLYSLSMVNVFDFSCLHSSNKSGRSAFLTSHTFLPLLSSVTGNITLMSHIALHLRTFAKCSGVSYEVFEIVVQICYRKSGLLKSEKGISVVPTIA